MLAMPNSRRDLFRAIPSAAARITGWAAMVQSIQAAPGIAAPENEDYWRMVKRQFPLDDNLIYLNAANVCPASRGVLDRHAELLRDFQANPSFQNREKYDPLAERCRKKWASMLGVTADEIAFVRNTSEGANTIVRGVDLKAGDEIIVTAHNHPSNLDSWKVRAKRDGLVVKVVAVPVPATSKQQLLDGLQQAITPRTRVITVSHVTNTTGVMYPAKEIAGIARRHNLWMHLDGAQTLGALDVNLREIGCDSYAGSAHKWPMGPLEAGVLYVRADRIPQVWPAIVTAGWSDNLVGARKLEVFGQRDNPRLVALEATVDFLQLVGMRHVEARMRALAQRAMRGLVEIPGAKLKTSMEPGLSGGVVKVDLPAKEMKPAYDALWQRHRISIANTASGDSRGLRISAHIYNTMEEMDRTVAAVREIAG
ncbi:MAG: aminotransferase class V-fold PLP-dependent enzyme [Acidobacteria bacterium]|nr:aminotransferase class V-fold PLP-dependent enzyme [Acidobacteriota bacterium]